MTLYLPPQLAAERRQHFEADVLARVVTDDQTARRYTAMLKRVDERLMMVKAQEQIEVGTPLVPGYYHVLRFNEDAPLSIFTLHDNGRFIEPNSKVFERLAAGNLHDPRVFRALAEIPRKAAEEAERERRRERDERQEELRDRVNAATRAQVSLDDSVPWSQNSDGRKRSGRG